MYVQFNEDTVNHHMQNMQAQAESHRQEMLARKSQQEDRIPGRVVVIGGGLAGLSAVRVAAQYYASVTLVERDEAAGVNDFRSGVPQARHTHNLLPEGLEILEQLFPGITSEMILAGAVPATTDQQYVYSEKTDRTPVSPNRSGHSVYASRPLVEALLYQRISSRSDVQVLKGWEAAGLETDVRKEKVTGVHLRRRGEEMTVPADIVLDTSGRNSKASRWLADAGLEPPRETRVDAFTGYASRIYQKPDGFHAAWKMLYIPPATPHQSRGGIILPLEGNRWHVTLLGMAKDYPPTDDDGFLEFAKSLPTDELSNAISKAEPLTRPSGYRLTQNRKMHYERLPRYIDGLLVAGDAVMSLNPVYAQGMTKALMEVQVLEQTLAENRRRLAQGNLEGFSRAFQVEISRATSNVWRMATDEDTCWPETMIIEGYSLERRVLPSCRRKTEFAPRAPIRAFQH